MNSMNDDRFFDLAMKVIARQSSDSERGELDALLARQPELRAEFERLQTEARIAKEALPLMDAAEATAGAFPAYARGRLQTKVRQTLGRPESAENAPDRSFAWGWRWWLGLAGAVAVLFAVAVPIFMRPSPAVIQVAMLDIAGSTRQGGNDDVALLGRTWSRSRVQLLSTAEALQDWRKEWPSDTRQPVVKVIFDRAAGEVVVLGRWKGKAFEKTFLVEGDLSNALLRAQEFVREQTR